MKKTLCKRICAILVSCMLFVSLLPVTAMAAESIDYVALGDSISTGYGLDDTDQSFPNDVAASAALSLTNLAKDGETTQSLLEKLKDADSPEIKAVATADVITVTIGGNDFMNVLYDFIAAQYNEGKEETAQITGEEVQKILADKTSPLRITVLMAAMKNFSEFVTSPETITAMQKFQQNFSSIIATIRSVNPDVLLMVTNLYNPYAAFPEEMKEISDVFDAAIVQINKQIAAGTDSYILLDLYTGFNEMLENTEESCCNAYYNSALDFDLDFHPNDMGHSLISAMVLKEIDTPVPMFALWVNNVDMLNGGSVPGVSFDPETNTLTLENAVIDTVCEEGYGDGIYAEGDLTIVLKGENVIRGEKMDYGIDVDPGSLTIIGDGSLEVEAVDNAIYAGENLLIGGTVDIQASAQERALYAGGSIFIGNENITSSATEVTIEKGALVAQEQSLQTLWVNNVDVLNGGSVPGVSFDPETNTLTLENAVIDTVCEEGYGDGIYAEGDLTIVLKGENVIRGEEMDYGIDVDPGSLTIIGDGSLEVEAVDNAIYVGENLVIGGTVNIQASARGSALYAGNVIKIGEEYFFLSDTDVTIQNGVLVEQVEPLEELFVNNVDMLNGGSVSGVSFDPQTNTLTLENAVIDTPYEAENAGIYAKGDLTIVLKGENVIRGNNINFGIGVHAGNLTISGDGSLEVEAAEIAMASQYYIIINESVSLDLHGKYNAFEAGDGVFVYATSKTYAEIWEGNTSVLMEKYPGFLSDMITPVQGMWVDGIIKYSPYFRCSFHEIVSGISASPSEITFETVTPDYEQPEAETVTIKNTGNMPLILTAPTSAAYEIEMPADTTLDVGESITVAIRPKADLDIGTYDETLSFTGAIDKISFFRGADSASNVAVASVNVSFAVKECYTLTFETNGGEAIDAITAFDGTVIDLADYVPTKADEVFTGWYADEALTEPVTNVTLDHSQTVYAGWKTTATEEMPDTGDNNTVAWWMMLLFAAGTAGLATAVYAKKKYSSK